MVPIASTPTAATELVDPGGAAALDEAREARVAAIGYRIERAALPLCDRVQPLTGLVLHDLASYDARDRAVVTTAYHLGEGFGVRIVVPGSAADRAGIRAGDEIVGLGDQDLNRYAPELIRSAGTADRVSRFTRALADAASAGPVTLTLRRAGVSVTTTLHADSGCGGVVTVASGLPNAWSDGYGVAVTDGLVDIAGSDEEIAFIVAHEISHNILHHAERTRGHSRVLAEFGLGAGVVKQTEIEADRFAVRLMLLAHYDPLGGETILRRLGKVTGPNLGLTHQTTGRRIETLHATAAELERTAPAAESTPHAP